MSLIQARLKVFADGHGDTLPGSFQLFECISTYRVVHERILNDQLTWEGRFEVSRFYLVFLCRE